MNYFFPHAALWQLFDNENQVLSDVDVLANLCMVLSPTEV
jgi:hypothetical protein